MNPNSIVPQIAKISEAIGAYEHYIEHQSAGGLNADPVKYLLSRCVDQCLASSIAFMRTEAHMSAAVAPVDRLLATSTLAKNAANDSLAMELAAIIRPTVELYVELLHLDDARKLYELPGPCTAILLNHWVGDAEQKLKGCRETYDCEPSIFRSIVEEHKPELQRLRNIYDEAGLATLANPKRRYQIARNRGDVLALAALGPDSFSAQAGLAYKLHFLPQKNIIARDSDLKLLHMWCGTVVLMAGAKLAELIGLDLSTLGLDILSDFQRASPVKSHCPPAGSHVLFDWGAGLVTNVRDGPLGNEVLEIEYEIPFMDRLSTPDYVPRRYMIGRLAPQRYSEVVLENGDPSWSPADWMRAFVEGEVDSAARTFAALRAALEP